jgi:hypothetical protein
MDIEAVEIEAVSIVETTLPARTIQKASASSAACCPCREGARQAFAAFRATHRSDLA